MENLQKKNENLYDISTNLYELSLVALCIKQQISILGCALEDRPALTLEGFNQVLTDMFDKAGKLEDEVGKIADDLFEFNKKLKEEA